MREQFRKKKKGDPLFAQDVNKLGKAARQVESGIPHIGLRSSWAADASPPPFLEVMARVQNSKTEYGDTDDSGKYLMRSRSYNQTDSIWEPEDEDVDLEIDVKSTSADSAYPQRSHVLVYDDFVGMRFDPQRGLWVPSSYMPYDKWVLTPSGGIPARVGTTEYSAVCTIMRQTLSADGTTIVWTTLEDADGNDVTRRVFNGYPTAVPGDSYVRVRHNSIGQLHVTDEVQSSAVNLIGLRAWAESYWVYDSWPDPDDNPVPFYYFHWFPSEANCGWSFSSVTNRFTCAIAGIWEITFVVNVHPRDAYGTWIRIVQERAAVSYNGVNGSMRHEWTTATSNIPNDGTSTMYRSDCEVGDTVHVTMERDSWHPESPKSTNPRIYTGYLNFLRVAESVTNEWQS